MWTPLPQRRFNPPSVTCAQDHPVRQVSAVSALASVSTSTQLLELDARAWVAGSWARQEKLRRLMVRENACYRTRATPSDLERIPLSLPQ